MFILFVTVEFGGGLARWPTRLWNTLYRILNLYSIRYTDTIIDLYRCFGIGCPTLPTWVFRICDTIISGSFLTSNSPRARNFVMLLCVNNQVLTHSVLYVVSLFISITRLDRMAWPWSRSDSDSNSNDSQPRAGDLRKIGMSCRENGSLI